MAKDKRNNKALFILLLLIPVAFYAFAEMRWGVLFSTWQNPKLLLLLLLLPPMLAFKLWKKDNNAAMQISTTAAMVHLRPTARYYLRNLPLFIRTAVMGLLIVALARPQTTLHEQTVTREGIDIVLALDISTSMGARDFKPDRISEAKKLATRFITDRPDDNIGLVIFAGEAYTQSPLTTDHATLINLTSRIELAAPKLRNGVVTQPVLDGTAIGNGLATAINRLKDSPAESKVIILLTDGVNNRGQITPLDAAAIAQTFGIKVYTIGVGSRGMASMPTAFDQNMRFVYSNVPVEIDEEVLGQIADMTGGRYYRATTSEKLKSIYDEINALEKSKVEIFNYTVHNEDYSVFILLAVILLIAELIVKNIFLRQIP